ncbi:hypothetical protein G6F22_018718 [Rhizopus arrhizus]|nr:hypothetical protein G6F23_015930 [Rhizopus arrhizus]KAG0762145.1 hypothetical protein G6F22_018718 [Rhizopus arrhizus]KAG0921021.1 hypothetical protein G6F31_020493 [Rhizopus arrhizus]KAG1225593.1 hypothetical protein G6F68_019896 [Rhizopus microsporus]
MAHPRHRLEELARIVQVHREEVALEAAGDRRSHRPRRHVMQLGVRHGLQLDRRQREERALHHPHHARQEHGANRQHG